MKGPLRLVRSDKIADYKHLRCIYEWSEGAVYLAVDRVSFKGKTGAILCYYNPPVHQVGNPGLDAYLEGVDRVHSLKSELSFLVLYGANDPVHAGGDLRESLTNLDRTLETRKQFEARGASSQEMDSLFAWADNRLKKGVALHGSIRTLSRSMRVVAVCGGGTRFGGSAEIPLMADFLVGDSRSGMCFSESMIGLIPGWGGVARVLVKAGLSNAAYMARSGKEVKAGGLKEAGVYNEVVEVPFAFPQRRKTDNPEADRSDYQKALDLHDEETVLLLLPRGLELATCPVDEIPRTVDSARKSLDGGRDISEEIARRADPANYAHLWGKSLREAREEIARLGRPLAPQSIEALDSLLKGYDPSSFDESLFVQREMEADARLYRDPRFRAGVTAALEQTVADFS